MEGQAVMKLLAPILLLSSVPGANEGTDINNATLENKTSQLPLFRRELVWKSGLNCSFTADSIQSSSSNITQG